MKLNYSAPLILGVISAVVFSSGSMAAQNTRSISLSASITSTSNSFSVDPLSSWPANALQITWSSTNKSFGNPSNVGFKVKSSADVKVSLSSTAKLTDGSKEIPIKVGITTTDTTKGGVAVSELSLTSQKIYDKTKNSAGDYVSYELTVAAQTTGMKDSSGATITAVAPSTTPEPAAGTYTGSIDLVFDSTI